MAVSMIGPKFYAWDRNGKPLAFGKLYTYQARTNTPKPTYQSEDQQVENTNPVILNGEGYANVYLDGSYKVILKDSDDSEIWSADPVTASQAEEWSDCMPATYNSPNSFVVAGNLTTMFDVGRRVRLEQGSSEYQYASVFDSSYAGGFTTVVVTQSVVTVSINEVCRSIIGRETIDVSSYSQLVFQTIQSVIDEITSGGEPVQLKDGDTIKTVGRINSGDGGGADYIAVTQAKYDALVGNSNGITAKGNGGDGSLAHYDFLIKNDLIAYKTKRDVVFTEQICDISIPSDVSGAFVASAHAGSKHYHFPNVTVDNVLIDSAPSVYVEGTGSITQSNGSELSVFHCRNTIGRVDIKNITINGNAANHAVIADRNDGACLKITGDSGGGFSVIGTKLRNNYSGATLLVIDNAQGTDEVRGTNIIAHNQITDAGLIGGPLLSDGMFINADNTDIYNNDIKNCTDYFIAIDYSKNIHVTKNRCKNGLVAVGVLGVTKCTVQDNTFDSCGLGIAVGLSGNLPVDPFVSRDVLIRGNTITNVTRDPSGTPNGDGIFVDPSAIDVRIEQNNINSAFRGIAASNPNCLILFNRVKNIGDRAYFCSGAGSIVVGNTYESAAAGPFYGDWSDKMIIDGEDKYIIDVTDFMGGWSNVGAPFRNAGYRVLYNQQKMVKLYGSVKGGTISPAQPIFQLPVGARPSASMRFVVADNTGSAIISVTTSGYVSYQSGAGTGINLDAIEFEAAD